MSRDVTTSLSVLVCYPSVGLTTVKLYPKYEVSMFTHYEDIKSDEKCKNWGGLGVRGHPRSSKTLTAQMTPVWQSSSSSFYWNQTSRPIDTNIKHTPTHIHTHTFREIRSSNSKVDRAHLWTSGTTRPKNSAPTIPIFAIFTPCETALGAGDKCGPHFTIW